LDLVANVVQFNDSSKCHSPTSHDAVDVGRNQEDAVAYHPNNARAELYAVEDSAAEVANKGTFEEHLVVVIRKMPKTKRKFGKGATRGGDRKTRQSGTGDQLVFAAEGDAAADIQATVSATSVAV
jgi:hypothetical protein